MTVGTAAGLRSERRIASRSRITARRCTLAIMWWPVDEPWQYRVLDAMPPSIDEAQLRRALEMTPTERIEAMLELMRTAEALRGGTERSVTSSAELKKTRT